MKKLLYLSLAFMLIAAMSGCGNNATTPSPELSPDISPIVSTSPGDDLLTGGDETGADTGTDTGNDTGTDTGSGNGMGTDSSPEVSPAS